MLSVDASGLADSLKKAEQEIERKLLGMVRKFTENFTEVAVAKTPIGDSVRYADLYASRPAGWPDKEGMARANWQVMDTDDLATIYSNDTSLPASDVASYFNSFYKLGETYYLGNATPYIKLLDQNNISDQTAGQGIKDPVIQSVLNIYQYQLDDYYKQS